MITAGAEYIEREGMEGQTPFIRISFLPYYWPTRLNDDGTFFEFSWVTPDRIQADYHGFTGGYWLSEVITSNLQLAGTQATITWDYNYPGFDVKLYWRYGTTTSELATASWVELAQGDTLSIYEYYQFKLVANGYRNWALEDQHVFDQYTAWAEDFEEDSYVPNTSLGSWDSYDSSGVDRASYAAEEHVDGEVQAYIENMVLLGVFTVVNDIEAAGTISQEIPDAFNDLVAGSYNGLVLSNRQGSLQDPDSSSIVESSGAPLDKVFIPAPLYSPNKSSFIFAEEADWYGTGAPGSGKQVRVDLGWDLGGFMSNPLNVTPMFNQAFSDFITLYLGKVIKWGPVIREADQNGVLQPHTVEVASKDLILDCLDKRVALPDEDGLPQPLTYGEFLCEGRDIVGWSPAPVAKGAYFEDNDYNELDHVISGGGGAFSLITPGLVGNYSFRCQTTGASQTAYGSMHLSASGEMFVTGRVRFTDIPGTIYSGGMKWLQLLQSNGTEDCYLSTTVDGFIYCSLGGTSKFNILGYENVTLSFGLWIDPSTNGHVRLFINGDEVLSYDANLSAKAPIEARFGTNTIAAAAETWIIDFDNVEIRQKYYLNAFLVDGGPFVDIGTVYIDNIAQPDSKTVGAYTQTLTRYATYGMVQFESTDPDFSVSGTVLIRVVENAGGRHALYILEDLLDKAGLTSYVDATILAEAYTTCPNDIINARFEGDSSKEETEVGNRGITVAECIKEICSRMLYWLFIDHGVIKIIPYTGVSPTLYDKGLTNSNTQAATQAIDMEFPNVYTGATYGWYERDSSLFYLAGDLVAGGQGTVLDYTWSSPVAVENLEVVKSKIDLLLKYLSVREILDPLRTNLGAARLELMDVVNVDDDIINDIPLNYLVARKDINLDPPRSVSLTGIRFLGE